MIADKARELGRLIGQTEEYKALRRNQDSLERESDLEPALERLKELSQEIEAGAAQGREPSDDQKEEYGRLVEEIQQDAKYQQMVAAQSNFDKLMYRVNEQIMEGIREGVSSRIITLD